MHMAYSLIGCFLIAERLLRRGESARSLEEGASDQGSTRDVGTTIGIAMITILAVPFLNRRRIGRLYGDRVAWGGVVVMLFGLLLRVWASLVLGASYTRTLRTSSEQRLITEGPYSVVRHPGYLGSLLLWLGAAIASANAVAMVLITFPLIRAYKRRIEAEEEMLAGAFPGEYEGYARRTWRLIPFIY